MSKATIRQEIDTILDSFPEEALEQLLILLKQLTDPASNSGVMGESNK